MARIAGVDLPREKRVEIGLTYIFGIGLATSKQILAETEINPDTRVKDLTETAFRRADGRRNRRQGRHGVWPQDRRGLCQGPRFRA